MTAIAASSDSNGVLLKTSRVSIFFEERATALVVFLFDRGDESELRTSSANSSSSVVLANLSYISVRSKFSPSAVAARVRSTRSARATSPIVL